MLPTKEDKSVESFDVRVVEETGSTNDDMKTHARSSRVSRPLVLEAKHQKAAWPFLFCCLFP